MRRYGPAALMLLVGAAVLRISLFSALYLRYVQPGLRGYLVASGALLVLLAVAAGVRSARQVPYEDEEGYEHAHDHTHAGPRLAWLLTLPATALLLFPPPALGSYSAAREDAQRAAQGVGRFPTLPVGDPVDLSVSAFSSRAVYDSGLSLKGRTVRLTGFVTHGDDGTWYVTRLLVSCCAADATTSKVQVRGTDAPATDTWVTITGTWHPKGGVGSSSAWPPVLDAKTVRQVDEPSDPYEKR
ncbi:TIGR03943 family putative permease subunit [Streptomyces sp. NRRL S-813]|uniref:TIGR03943 family putative permease subunit n=1 Tax=Streptomyces sp. NRRL S-813 TaxID=1463919 RepID=UPI0004C1B019|nr:TIGR03943 family protein [Streptomyces sp. NRRL S-813]